MSQEDQEPSKGYFYVPRQLRIDVMQAGINTIKLVYFIADETLGWASHWALLTYSEILTGCTWHSGDGAGLPNDTAISRAMKEALERRLIEVRQAPTGTLYAIHRRFWALTKLKPVWTIYKRLPSDETADPLTLESVAITRIAEQAENTGDSRRAAISWLADAHQDASSLLSPGQRPVIPMIAEKSSGAAPEEGRDVPKKTFQERRREKKKESVAASPRSPDGSPLLSEKDEEGQEAQPDLMTLRVEYTTLSHQLAQLDVNKQAGQWARLYRQLKAAEERLHQAEQERSPASAEPPECAKHQPEDAKRQAAPANEGGANMPPTEMKAADERQAHLRALTSELIYWQGGLKALQQARLPKWRGVFKWQIEAKIAALETEYATLRAEGANPGG